jgi:hypothetical protein
LVRRRRTYLGFEGDLGWLEGVLPGNHDVEGERAAGVGAAGGAVDDHLEVVRVRRRRRARTAERRRVGPQLGQLLPDPLDRQHTPPKFHSPPPCRL